MRNFMQKFMMFMQGRYGLDSLNKFLFGVLFVLMFVKLFVFNLVADLVISNIQLLILAWLIFRFLSKNINRRALENRNFLKAWNPVKSWFKLTMQKFKDRKEYRYLKCPVCNSQLRVKNRKGVHSIRCPRCKSEFSKKI